MPAESRQTSTERERLISDGRLAPYGCFLPAVDIAGNYLRLSTDGLAASGFEFAAAAKLKRENVK